MALIKVEQRHRDAAAKALRKVGRGLLADHKEAVAVVFADFEASLPRTTPDLPERGGWRELVQSLVTSIECAAGCDEDADADTKSGDVLSWAGSAVGVGYDKAIHALTKAPAPAGELEKMRHTAMLDRAASQEHAAAYRESQALVHKLRMALHMIDVEASNTIPPDGKDAAFAALGRIIRIINPFRTHPGATTKGG